MEVVQVLVVVSWGGSVVVVLTLVVRWLDYLLVSIEEARWDEEHL